MRVLKTRTYAKATQQLFSRKLLEGQHFYISKLNKDVLSLYKNTQTFPQKYINLRVVDFMISRVLQLIYILRISDHAIL